MSREPATVRYAMELYYEPDVRRRGFAGAVGDLPIVGSADTLEWAQRQSLAALRAAFESLRQDGRLPADPARARVPAAS